MEKESMPIFIEDVVELKDRVVELTRSHAILWVLWDTENNKRYSHEIESHWDYFQGVGSSLFQGFCVITYQLFDKRNDVKSMPDLISYLSSLNPKLEQQLKSNINSQKPLLDKYFSYRNNIFAHRNKAKRPWDVFGKQSKTRVKSEMKGIVDLAQKITMALAEATGLDKDEFDENFRLREEYAAAGAIEVFKALEKASPLSTCHPIKSK
jgi:hypothetical protein